MCHILFGIILYYYLLLFICSFFNVFVGVLITNTIQVKPWASRSHICRSSFVVASLPSFWVAGHIPCEGKFQKFMLHVSKLLTY